MANKDTKYTIEVELKGDSKQVQKAVKDGLSKDFSAKIGADTSKLSRDINTAIKELNSSDKKVKIGIDGSNIVKDINNALKSIESDSLKKIKLGVDTSNILRDINKAITSINSGDSLKKLKLDVDVNYLQQQLNKAVKGLDTTIKVNTKLETTSRTTDTKGTVTTSKTSKEEADTYQSLFSKRAASIQNLDKAYQEFGRGSKEVSAALREFAAASKDVRKFGRDTGVLSLNKVKSDIERQLGAGLTTDFTKNWLRMEYDKVLKDIDTLNRQLKPEKYEKAEDDARVKAYNQEYKIRQAIAAAQAKADKDAERAYKERERVLNEELKIRLALGKKGLSGGLSVDEVKNIKEANQATTALSSQFARLRAEALKAGNALNQATNPKDAERLRANFEKAIQALVNYQRASRGLTKKGEGQLVEKLAIGNIKEGTKAYQVLEEWIKKCEQAQKNLNQTVGRSKLANDVKNNTLLGWLQNMDMGRALSGMAYAARGELNTVQSFGNLLSSLSNVSGVIGTFAKGLGALGIAVMAFTGMLNLAMSALNGLVNTLTQVGQAVYNALKPGIELYKLRETAQLSFAATLSNMATEEGKPISYERGLEMSADLVNRAFMDALKSAFNPEELIRAMQGTLGIAFAKGLNLEQAYNVVKSTAAVGKSIQLPQNQLLQEVRDILQGTLSARSSQVAYAVGMTPDSLREAQSVGARIGLTDEGIQQAEEQGRLYDYIMEKMQTYNIALEKYADTFSGAMDRLTEAWALAGMKIFEKIAPGLNGVIDNIINDFILTVDENNMPQISDNLKQVGEALDEIIFKIMADADALIDLIKDVTGEEDTIGAIKALILDAIDLTAWGLGILIVVVDGLKDVTIKAYNGFTYLKNAAGLAIDFIYNLSAALFDLTTFDFKSIGKRLDDLDKKYGNRSLGDILSEGIIDEKQMRGGLGFGHRGKFYQAYGEGHVMYDNNKPRKQTDMNNVTSKMTQENKPKLSELRKELQAALEEIKRDLKEYINKLKDLQEKNSLAYQQGFRSMDDYFRTKAQIELQEASARLNAIEKEIAKVQALDTGGDKSAEYQKERDLIRLDTERNDALRKLNKAVETQTDVTKQLLARREIMTSGSYVGTSKAGIKDALDYTTNTYNELQGSALMNSQMQLMSVGCVEAVEKAMSSFTTLGEESYDMGIRGVDALLDYFKEKGVQIIPYDQSKLAEGDIAFMGHSEDDLWHVVMYHLGQWLGNHGSGDEAITNMHDLDWYEGYYDNLFIAKVSEAGEYFKENVKQALGTVAEMPEATTVGGKEVRDAAIKALEEQWQAQKILTDSFYNFDEAIEASAVLLENEFNKKLRRATVTLQDDKLADIYKKQNVFDKIKMVADQSAKYLDSTLKEMKRTGLARNLNFQHITMLVQDTIDHYFDDAFSSFSNVFSPARMLENLLQQATEAEKAGFTFEAQNIRDKIESFVSGFAGIIDQWISRAAEYFDMQRNIVDANSGLTNFVKEERKSQLSKGQARWNAKAYEAEVKNLDNLIAKTRERNDLDDRTKNGYITQLELLREKNSLLQRQNELLGEEKTLWQETMDAANQALEDGLYKFMTDYVNTAESVGEAFRNLAIDILSDLQKFFAKKAITDLMHVITGEPNLQYFAPQATQQNAQMTGNAVQQIVNAINPAQTAKEVADSQSQQIIQNQILGVDGQQLGVTQQILYYVTNMFGTLQQIAMSLNNMQISQQSSMFSNIGSSITQPSTLPSAGKRATGGYISGPGTSTSDSIHAMLSNGEYVIKADAVRKYGLNFLDAVNSGHFTRMRTVIPRFADGGYVGDALQDTARGMTDFAKNLGTSVGVDNTISIALVRDEQEAIREWAKSPSGGQKFLVDFAKGNGRVFSRFNR